MRVLVVITVEADSDGWHQAFEFSRVQVECAIVALLETDCRNQLVGP